MMQSNDKNRGFTLVELLVTLAITSIVMVSVYAFFSKFTATYTRENNQRQLQQSLRAVLNVMTLELRSTGADPLSTGQFGVVCAEPDRIEVKADQNVNGVLDEDKDSSLEERVSYYLDGDKLRRKTWAWHEDKKKEVEDTQSLVEGIKELKFVYRDKDGQVTDDKDDVRLVEIVISGEEQAGRGETVLRTYRTTVMLRNMNT